MLVGEIIVSGRKVPLPGAFAVTWESDPARCPRVTKGSERRPENVTAVVLHTSRGAVGRVVPGSGSGEKAARLARYQVRGDREASWHFTVGADGVVLQQADAGDFTTWHASHANSWSVGIECAQTRESPDLTQAQVDACVSLVHALCDALRIPKRLPARSHDGESWSVESRPVRAWQSRKQGGESRAASGVIGHRNLTTNRGPGDPGDPLMLALLASGFAAVDPAAMTVGAAPTVDAPEAPETTHDEDGDAPAWPPLPSWLDPALEVDASRDLPDDLAAFVRAQAPHLAALGVTGDRAAELLAHAATECGRGRRAHANNFFGAKIRERDDRAHREKHGRGLGWWRDFGHVESGDDEVEYYRAFDSAADAWRWFVWRHVGRPDEAPSSERYAATGRAFWSDTPSRWFVELLRAGYRGSRRATEVAAQGDAHPSVVSHRALVSRVRGLLL